MQWENFGRVDRAIVESIVSYDAGKTTTKWAVVLLQRLNEEQINRFRADVFESEDEARALAGKIEDMLAEEHTKIARELRGTG